MYRVAILEDEKVYARIFEDYIGEFLKVREINYQVDIYETTKELEENINKDYHLFVLDHLAQDMNGMNFVRSLKSMGCNANIIFVADHEEHLKRELEIQGVYKLSKPIKEIELKEILRMCLIDYLSQESITLVKDEMEVEIHPEDIFFIEHIYNGIKVQGENYPVCTLDSVEDLYPIIEGKQFFQCHKEYIVNLKYVREIEKYDFKMLNGQVVPIAKNMYKTAQRELLEYIK